MTTTADSQCIAVDDNKNVISIKASLTGFIVKEKPGMYVSYCPALELCSQGKTPKHAERMIIEATKIFIEDCLERGILNDVLKECGFYSIYQNPPRKKNKKGTATNPKVRQIEFPAELPVMAFG